MADFYCDEDDAEWPSSNQAQGTLVESGSKASNFGADYEDELDDWPTYDSSTVPQSPPKPSTVLGQTPIEFGWFSPSGSDLDRSKAQSISPVIAFDSERNGSQLISAATNTDLDRNRAQSISSDRSQVPSSISTTSKVRLEISKTSDLMPRKEMKDAECQTDLPNDVDILRQLLEDEEIFKLASQRYTPLIHKIWKGLRW